MKRIMTILVMCSLALGWAAAARSADEPKSEPQDRASAAPMTFRASALTGLDVRNMQGETLGSIEDLVIDVRGGKLEYAAVSVGGIFGFGDKLFAVPFGELKLDRGEDEMFFVLDISKEKLQAAPGFDQSNWPNFADPHWSDQVDKYYREARAKEQPRQTTTGRSDE